jgi:hypothetical protein
MSLGLIGVVTMRFAFVLGTLFSCATMLESLPAEAAIAPQGVAPATMTAPSDVQNVSWYWHGRRWYHRRWYGRHFVGGVWVAPHWGYY